MSSLLTEHFGLDPFSPPSGKAFIIYHRADFDGKASRAIVEHWLNARFAELNRSISIECIGADYGDDHSAILRRVAPDSLVFMVDFSLLNTESDESPAAPTHNLALRSHCLVWIDHHASAIKAAETVEWGLNVVRVFNTTRAACELAWDFLHPNELMPEIIRLIGRYDVWDHTDPRTLAVQAGIRYTFSEIGLEVKDKRGREVREKELWTFILDSATAPSYPPLFTEWFIGVMEKGRTLEKNMLFEARSSVPSMIRFYVDTTDLPAHAVNLPYTKLRVAALNDQRFTSRMFTAEVEQNELKYDLLIIFAIRVTNSGLRWKLGFYSENPNIDCSAIAESLGGGGHRSAAGAHVPVLPGWLDVLPYL